MSSNESLIMAVWDERADLVQAALLKGADVDAIDNIDVAGGRSRHQGCTAKTNDGKTALSLAAGSGSLEIAEQLRRAGAAE